MLEVKREHCKYLLFLIHVKTGPIIVTYSYLTDK